MVKNKNKIKNVLYAVALSVAVVFFMFAGHMQQKHYIFEDPKVISKGNYDEQDVIVLEYYTWDDESFYVEPITESFNSINPDVEVRVSYLDSDYDSYDNKIPNLVKNNDNIDIIGIRGLSKMVQYQNDGLLIDITLLIQNSSIDITNYGNMYNNVSVEGRYYGLPTRSTCWVLVYNKDIFDKYNEEYPKQLTWDEYRELSLRISEKASDDGIWGGYFAPWNYNFGGVVHSNYLYDDNLIYAKGSLELLNSFMNIDKSHMNVEQMEGSEYNWLELFEEGKIAMMPQGEWFVGMVMDDIKAGKTSVEWDLAPMPIFEEQKEGTTWGQYQFIGITKNCEYIEAAFAFLNYFSGEKGAEILAQHGMLGAYSSEETQIIYEEAVGDKNTRVFFDALRIQEQPIYENYEKLHLLFNEISETYLAGEIAIDEAMAEFVARRKELNTWKK